VHRVVFADVDIAAVLRALGLTVGLRVKCFGQRKDSVDKIRPSGAFDGLSSLRRAQGRRVLGGVHFIQRKRFAQRRARQQRKRQQQGEETIAHPSYLISIRRLNSHYSTERAKTQSSGAGEGAAAG